MKAVLMTNKGVVVDDLPDPTPRPNEVVIRVRAAGICGTDLAIIKGAYKVSLPLILGHEFSGEIALVGKHVVNVRPGDRVTSEINISCGQCYYCKVGLRTHCLHVRALGITTNGAFAEYVKVPSENVHKIPESLSDEHAVFVEPLAAAIRTIMLTRVDPEDFVAVIGVGRLGLLIIQVMKLHMAKVIAVGKNLQQLKIAKIIGADYVVNATKENPVKRIKEIANGIGADVVVEATGNPNALNVAIASAKSRGSIAVKSTPGLQAKIDLTQVVVRELTVQGSRCGPFSQAINLLSTKMIRVEPLISKRFKLVQAHIGFKSALQPGVIKVLLKN